jgi:hypothetical protein
MTATARPADILIAAGITFTCLHRWNDFYVNKKGERVELGKAPKGKNWQTRPYTADEARRHYKTGGNVGTHCGELSAGVIWVDVDDGRFPEFCTLDPRFQDDPIVSYRDNAPGRGKIAIKVIGEIPAPQKFKHDVKDKSPFFEVLSTGNQAAIIGTHPSGAAYKLRGSNLVTMTRAELNAVVLAWTGQKLEAPEARQKRQARQDAPQAPTYTPSDPDSLIEQVKAAWSILSVFQRFGLASHGTEEARNGETRVLGNGGLLIKKDGALWSIPGNGRGFGGNAFHAWHYAKHGRLVDFHTDKTAFRDTLLEMAEAAGIEIPKFQPSGVIDPEEVRAEVDYLRGWVKSTSFAPYVPAELQSAAGYRTDSTDTKIAHAVLDVCHERGTWRIYVSRRTLALRAGLGSHETAQAALQRLSGWFVALHDDGMIELVARRSATSLSALLVDDLVADLRATNYGDMMADDVFLTGSSKTAKNRVRRQAAELSAAGIALDETELTPQERDSLTAARDRQAAAESGADKDEDLIVVAWDKRLWAATESGLGESAARVIDAIFTHGDMTRAELVDATGKTKSAIGRITLRLDRLGLLVADQEAPRAPKVYGLADDWQDRIEALRPTLKTHKLSVERRKRNEEQLIGYCDRELKRKSVDEERRRNLAKRRARSEKRLADLVAQLDEGIDVDRWVATPSATHARFDYAPILQDRRSERFLADSEILSDLTATPGRILWRDELARGRHAAGRLGVNFADYVDSQSLQMAAD